MWNNCCCKLIGYTWLRDTNWAGSVALSQDTSKSPVWYRLERSKSDANFVSNSNRYAIVNSTDDTLFETISEPVDPKDEFCIWLGKKKKGISGDQRIETLISEAWEYFTYKQSSICVHAGFDPAAVESHWCHVANKIIYSVSLQTFFLKFQSFLRFGSNSEQLFEFQHLDSTQEARCCEGIKRPWPSLSKLNLTASASTVLYQLDCLGKQAPNLLRNTECGCHLSDFQYFLLLTKRPCI